VEQLDEAAMTTVCQLTPPPISDSTTPPSAAPTAGSTLNTEVGAAVRRYLEGDRDAMTDLVRRVRPWLHRIALNHGLDHHSAEDVVQETLLALIEHVHRLRDPGAGLGWLSTVARNQSIHKIRTGKRTVLRGEPAEWTDRAGPDDPEKSAIDALTGAVLAEAITQLPTRCGQILHLAFLADVSDYATISQVLDMPVGSVGPTRMRALRKMREILPPGMARDLGASA
jgi:RNA polymerase sigma factor (sigma-70 family)